MATRHRLAGAGITVTITAVIATGFAQANAETQAETATGVVFDDRDRDGKRDSGEPGVPGVSVSNGRDVVRTDKDGRYTLAVDDQTIIFISKPAGWGVPVNDVQLPQFYYTHFPNGSPHELRYGGVAPTGPLPDSVDFPMFKDGSRDASFKAIGFADPQTANLEQIDHMTADVINQLTGTDASFGLTVGDVVNDPLDLFAPHNEAVAKIGIPWWNIPGNHDQDYDAPTDANATDTYKATFGPTNYSFDYGQVHFVLMDNVEHVGPNRGYRGYLSAEQLEWLENDLSYVPKNKLVVIGTHIPLATDATTSASVNTVNVRDLLTVLKDREHVYSMSGHDTSNSWQMYLDDEDGWHGSDEFHHQVLAEVRGGGWTTGPTDERGIQAADMSDGNPNGYYQLTFRGHGYTPRFTPASLPADYQIRLTFDGGQENMIRIPTGPSGSAGFADGAVSYLASDWADAVTAKPTVTANVFDGGERHTVEIKIDKGQYVPMTHLSPRNDPYIATLRATLSGSQRPAAPEPSSHLWSYQLPAGLAAGKHSITVRSTDPYGQVSETTETFEVTAADR